MYNSTQHIPRDTRSFAQSIPGLRLLPHIALAFALSFALLQPSNESVAARQLPQDATFAKAAKFHYPYFKLAKQTLRLAVGSRIYDRNNLIIMPAAAPATANILFKTDTNGELSEVWILSEEETKPYVKAPFQTKKLQ